ncbi:HepT-like ribonuclease domain-containing protein [Cyclobacterium salsum]|uniref:HepT-like ribonuclease domain-containing protein n=1 Tax=Cyclobacterium salsum TaxID=2666329 RepID=UPI001391EDFC|nr:HepT-like ribonuclease domain-containing protein [Cyclobacterium salsum]
MSLLPNELLRHILDECEYLKREYESNSFDEFIKNERLIRAICRSLEIIGEASNKLDPAFKKKYSSIPWREMGDIRNKIIHDYFGVDFDIIWDVVKSEIPILKSEINKILSNEKS